MLPMPAGRPEPGGTRFRAVTDVAGASGPAVTGPGGPVVTGKGFRTVTEVAGASGLAGTGAGGPVVAGTRFLAVAEVYAPFEETEGDLQGDIGRVDQSWPRLVTRGAWRAVLPDRVEEPNPVHGPGKTS